MRREAERTLYSLSDQYQQYVDPSLWEVIVIDNGSTKPLDKNNVSKFGKNFRYFFFDTTSTSPVQAINFGVEQANSELVTICIDGARILSPGVLHYTLKAFKAFDNPIVCTHSWHLGKQLQNIALQNGYDQLQEDQLLSSINWKKNGYELFNISSLAGSTRGFFSEIVESNCFTLKKETYLKIYGYDIRFTAPGGGSANLDFYKRVTEQSDVQTIHLLGEGTFHQFHGGVTTNIPINQHPKRQNRSQYKQIRGYDYKKPDIKQFYIGHFPKEAKQFIYARPSLSLIKKLVYNSSKVIKKITQIKTWH